MSIINLLEAKNISNTHKITILVITKIISVIIKTKMFIKILLIKLWMIYYKITSQNLHQNNKTIIHINTIIINIKTIIGISIPIPIINCIKIKTISIPLYNILNQIQIIHQIINHKLPLSPDKIISYHKTNGN